MKKKIGELTLFEIVDMASKVKKCKECELSDFCEINYNEMNSCLENIFGLDQEVEVENDKR